MLFKYKKTHGSEPIWALVDGLSEVEWTWGWAVKYSPIQPDEADEPDEQPALGVTMKDPGENRVGAVNALVPARLHLSERSRKQLLNDEVAAIPVVVLHLSRSESDVTLPLAVEAGYILNDDGRTVEKLMAR